MIIEPFKKEDVEKVAFACIEYAQEIGEPYDEDYIVETLGKVSDRKLPFLVAKDKAGEIMGVSAFVCIPHLYNNNIMEARECIWHTSPKLCNFARARLQKDLLEIMMMTCQKQGISLYVSVPENSSMADLLESRGFKVKNILYAKSGECDSYQFGQVGRDTAEPLKRPGRPRAVRRVAEPGIQGFSLGSSHARET